MTTLAWDQLDNEELSDLAAGLAAVAEPVITAGGVRYPNGMGMAPAAETAVIA